MKKELNVATHFILFCMPLLFLSCEEVVDIDLKNSTSRLVIEGGIFLYDEGDNHVQRIQLKNSVDFFSNVSSEPIADAQVNVTDGFNQFNFIHQGDGVYEQVVAAVSGRTYTLTINWKQQKFQASGVMQQAVAIEKYDLEYKDLTNDPFADGNKTGYVANISFTDPASNRNFYLLKLFINGQPTFIPDPGNRLNAISEDQYYNGKTLNDVEVNNEYLAQPLDEMTVQLLSISEAQYDFYYELFSLTSSNSLLGDPPRSRLIGNVANLSQPNNWALGFFQVAGVSQRSKQVP